MLLSEGMEWTSGVEMPCEKNRDIFDSQFVTDFDPDNYLENEPDATESQILQAERIHRMAQPGAIKQAVDLCKACPVLNECRAWVMKEETKAKPIYGVVGAMTENERIALRRGQVAA